MLHARSRASLEVLEATVESLRKALSGNSEYYTYCRIGPRGSNKRNNRNILNDLFAHAGGRPTSGSGTNWSRLHARRDEIRGREGQLAAKKAQLDRVKAKL